MPVQFERLFTPIQVGRKTVRNRIVFPCHATRFPFFRDEATPEQYRQYIEYMQARARGGCGLAVIGSVHVHWSSKRMGQLTPPTPELLVPKLRKMADALHEHGTLLVAQIMHFGNTKDTQEAIRPNWGFTARPSPDGRGEVCHEMSAEEVEEVINGFVTYAKCMQEGGLDGIELHGAHGYLLQQSWTSWANQRSDRWGKQMAFSTEVIDRVRAAVGSDFLVGTRIVGDDWHVNGMDNEAMQKVAQALEATGKVDYISTSEGSQSSHYALSIGTMFIPPAAWVPLASGIKQAVKSVPVIAGSRVNDPALAENILADGHADMIYVCRGQIADPEFANKAREGRTEDIRLCIACNQGCYDRIQMRMHITCVQNPVVGKERETGALKTAQVKKKVMVIGGGPGGMEAARVAALRGHDVTLYEKTNQLGGQINVLTRVPAREEFGQVTRYLTTQLNRLGVKVRLGTEATVDTVKREKPDAVLVATGSIPYRVPVPGNDQDNVLTVAQALEGAPAGEQVVIYDTTGLQEAVTVADFLADQGKKVRIVTPMSTVGAFIGFTNQIALLPRLRNKGVIFTVSTSLKGIDGRMLTLADVHTEEQSTLEGIDTVVLSTGYRVNDSLYRALKGQVKELYAVGDCYSPRRAMDAIHEGYNTGLKI